jgi:ADP-heptose:LPS heptosyltransferase
MAIEALPNAPVDSPLPAVRKIAVLRGGALGDLIMALPAMHALKESYPGATLTLLGTQSYARLLAGRPGPVHEVLPLPLRDGEARYLDVARARRFDLAVQLHGGGRWSNPFVLGLGARYAVGSRAEDAPPLDRTLPFAYYHHETLRALQVAELAGARTSAIDPVLSVCSDDLAAADLVLEGLPLPLVTVHPGATDPRRRWPHQRFARVAAALAGDGCGVAVVGTAAETDLVQRVVAGAGSTAVRSLAGMLDERALVGVLARSAVLVGNDSGPRHLAAAVGTPTVAVYWVGNVINAGPLSLARNRVHISWTVRCPVCGQPYEPMTYPRCGHDVTFVDDVAVDGVLADTRALLHQAVP